MALQSCRNIHVISEFSNTGLSFHSQHFIWNCSFVKIFSPKYFFESDRELCHQHNNDFRMTFGLDLFKYGREFVSKSWESSNCHHNFCCLKVNVIQNDNLNVVMGTAYITPLCAMDMLTVMTSQMNSTVQ